MPILKWNLYDFIGCLAVEPQVEEDYVYHHFQVAKNGAVLQLMVWQYESAIEITLGLESTQQPLTRFFLFVRGEALGREEGNDEWLELRDCVVGPSRFSAYGEMGDVFDQRRYPQGACVRIRVSPGIQVEFMRAIV